MEHFHYDLAGFLGVVLYLGSYALLQTGVLRGGSYAYASLNLVAAALVLWSLQQDWNLASAVIQISWIVISIVGLTRIWLLMRRLKFSDRENELLGACFPRLRRLEARRLLNAGAWPTGAEGDMLTEQGEPVRHLCYIAEGGASVIVDGQIIAWIGPGELVGEFNCLTEGPASATVVLDRPTRYFAISSAALLGLVRSNPELEVHLHFAFNGHAQSKLLGSNAALSRALRDAAAQTG